MHVLCFSIGEWGPLNWLNREKGLFFVNMECTSHLKWYGTCLTNIEKKYFKRNYKTNEESNGTLPLNGFRICCLSICVRDRAFPPKLVLQKKSQNNIIYVQPISLQGYQWWHFTDCYLGTVLVHTVHIYKGIIFFKFVKTKIFLWLYLWGSKILHKGNRDW